MSSALQVKCEEEQLRISMADSKNVSPRRCNPSLIICLILISVTSAGMFCFCFVYPRLVKDLCYAHAKYEVNSEWKWNTTRCGPRHINAKNNMVNIISAGVYITDIQVLANNETGITHVVLKIEAKSIKKEFVGGAFKSTNLNESYARLSQILVLNEGDTVELTLRGIEKTFSGADKNTYWKILKVKDL